MRKFLIGFRTSIKVIALFAISLIIIFTVAMCVYKPIYSVTLNGEMLGYSKDRAELQSKIYSYIEAEDAEDVAFVQIDNMPEYKLCFLKRDIETNDEEIYEKIISTGRPYYRFYALAVNNEEKVYVATFNEAQEIVNTLKEKNSNNVDSLAIREKHATEKKEFSDKEKAVATLYEQRKVVVANNSGKGSGVTRAKVGVGYKSAGIKFIKPVSGRVSSRYGPRWGTTHKGTDIAAPTGTPIKAAASGTVTFAGTYGTYGKLIIVSHGNGVQTYYGHCSAITTKVGANVEQGDVIGKVGETGNAQGAHLHFEIRINGVSYNAEQYI